MNASTIPKLIAESTTMPGANSSEAGLFSGTNILKSTRNSPTPRIKPVILTIKFIIKHLILFCEYSFTLRTFDDHLFFGSIKSNCNAGSNSKGIRCGCFKRDGVAAIRYSNGGAIPDNCHFCSING